MALHKTAEHARQSDKELKALISAWGLDWSYIEGQNLGSCGDIIKSDGTVVEVKTDKAAAKYGNLFIEFKSTKKDMTGITHAAELNQHILFIVPLADEYQLFYHENPKALLDYCITSKCKIKPTAIGKNGNHGDYQTFGYILPIKHAAEAGFELSVKAKA